MRPITMLESRDGSPDGIRVFRYLAGETYPDEATPMSEDLRTVFLREGWATDADELGEPVSTMVEQAAEAMAVCGVLTARGTPCQQRLPCRLHSD